ncbi:MAG: DUF1761 domain-containing protein [Bauldia sp.]
MDMSVNWWAVIVAAIVMFVIGAVWYSPPLFAGRWRTLLGMSEEQMRAGLPAGMVAGIVSYLVMAYILARFIIHYGTPSLGSGVLVGFMAWLGFVATVLIGQVFYERRSFTLWLINNGYLLIGLLVMGAILGWWHSGGAAPTAA